MDKASVIVSFKAGLKVRYERAVSAAETAAEGATGDDARAESKYDTRGLESSYLAAGQAGLADDLAHALEVVERFEFPDFLNGALIDTGALVSVEFEGELDWYLLATGSGGGGMECESNDGTTVTILGVEAPLAIRLRGRKAGEKLENSEMKILEVM